MNNLPNPMHKKMPKTAVLHLFMRNEEKTDLQRTPQSRLQEMVRLAQALDLPVAWQNVVTLSRRVPATLLGGGKVEELATVWQENEIELVVINHHVSPVQQRNLEQAWNCKVWDRTGLILEIFAARARTGEGKLQVELASLQYQKSRLVRTWTHLERQRGGFGFMAGPGETQIETDRRLLSEKITRIKRELETVVRTRGLHRKARKRVPYPVVALVGYTNAGKSTLFNRLGKAAVKAEDVLFATLDPTMRRVVLPSGSTIILSDTVGFITDLPHELVAAFRATLEEVIEADILLHVRDISHPEAEAQREDVLEVLARLGVEREQIPLLEVWNKADALSAEIRDSLEENTAQKQGLVLLSAATGWGCDELLGQLEEQIRRHEKCYFITLNSSDGELLAWLYRHGEIISREDKDAEIKLQVRLSVERFLQWQKISA
jgi:GTP-binding protein HflX